MSIEPTGNRVPEWTLGERLRKSRGDAELEQQELADRIGASRQSISGPQRPEHVVPRAVPRVRSSSTGGRPRSGSWSCGRRRDG